MSAWLEKKSAQAVGSNTQRGFQLVLTDLWDISITTGQTELFPLFSTTGVTNEKYTLVDVFMLRMSIESYWVTLWLKYRQATVKVLPWLISKPTYSTRRLRQNLYCLPSSPFIQIHLIVFLWSDTRSWFQILLTCKRKKIIKIIVGELQPIVHCYVRRNLWVLRVVIDQTHWSWNWVI